MPTPSPARVHECTVVKNEPIAQDIFALRIASPELARMLEPGQFVDIAVPGNAMSLLRIPLSFAEADAETGTIDIWYAVVGEGTERLSRMEPGATTTVLGPGGHGWTIPEGCRRALLVAGGIGVPPILCLARELARRNIPYTVCIGVASADRLVGEAEFEAAGSPVISIATDDGSAGYHGFCTAAAEQVLETEGDDFDYVATCGPEPMMAKVAAAAERAGVACEASLERMMSCGFGACATCAVETRSGMKGACMCGPVFDAKEVVW